MKIIVCSDSHGNDFGLRELIELERPQAVYFLGDGERDWRQVDLPYTTAFAAVCGNCDMMSMEPPYRKFELYGHTVFLTHGHLYGVKQGLSGLHGQALQHDADLVFYGHTHCAKMVEMDGCTLVCPGTMSSGKEEYVVLDIKPDGSYTLDFRKL